MTTVHALPRAANTAATESPDLWSWWALASFASATATFTTLYAMRRLMEVSNNPVLESLGGLLWLGGLAAPLIIALKGLVVGSVVWAVLELLGVRSGYLRCLAATYSAEIALALAALLQGVVALLRGPASVQDFVVPIGLDLVWHPASPTAAVLSSSVTPFLLAWTVIMFLHLHGEAKPHRAKLAAGVCAGAAIVACMPLLSVL